MIKFKWFGHGNGKKTTPTPSTEAAGQAAQLAAAETQGKPDGKRVLIVDDDQVFLTATATKLRAAGFQVRTVRESAEAIAALGEQPVDAVLMDIDFQPDVCNGGMGSWDGFQLTTWLRGNPSAKGARFIMVTNSNADSDRQRARQVGAVAYFRKPVDHAQLIAAVNAEN